MCITKHICKEQISDVVEIIDIYVEKAFITFNKHGNIAVTFWT
jgi:hypothetical protein